MTYIPFLEDKIKEHLDRKNGDKPTICISGLSGSGKGTAGKFLQEELSKRGLKLKIYDSGLFFRKIAKEMGYEEAKLNEFNEKVTSDMKLAEEIDKKMELMTVTTALNTGGIFLGRLTFAALGNLADIKIFITTKNKTIAERISADKNRPEYGQSVTEIAERIKKRDEADIARYNKLYNIDYLELVNKCIIIENSETKEELRDDLVDIVVPILKERGFLE